MPQAPLMIVVMFGVLASTTLVASAADLVLVSDGRSDAKVLVRAQAGAWENQAAQDLVHYIEVMSGVKLPLVSDPAQVDAALKSDKPALVVGELALTLQPELRARLDAAAKPKEVLRADAIVLHRNGARVYMAGRNDDSHYYAVAQLLQRWGCRWYMPSEFGECIPQRATLTLGDLDFAYGPFFEVRHYWNAWNGHQEDRPAFLRRNMMNDVNVPAGHVLNTYTRDLTPPGKTMFNIPITDPKTAQHVADKIEKDYAEGKNTSLGMEDGIYSSDYAGDTEIKANLYDKYFLTHSQTDAFMTLYNNVARILQAKHPQSSAKLGFLAYSNITLPPQREWMAERPLVCYLAPIDFDPIHSMDDARHPSRQEYKAVMYRWAQLMQGRVVIYDYDQSMLVWRDIPNPALPSLRDDIKHYRRAGILGLATETRNAIATTFLNFHLRGQLYWNPDADVDAMLSEFYPTFFGPAGSAMERYWSRIHQAWIDTVVTEHEHFVIPAIYTPQLVAELGNDLAEGQRAMAPLRGKSDPTRLEKQYLERLRFMELCFDMLRQYTESAWAAAHEADYVKAAAIGAKGLATRLELAKMNPNFTTRVIGVAAETQEGGPPWWTGEVKQYRDLSALMTGEKGTLIARLPLEWSFRTDPRDTGFASGWAYSDWPDADPSRRTLRTDLYMQAQGVLHPDRQSYTGHAWYRTAVTLTPDQVAGKTHLRFPGLFNEGWLYVNGNLVAYRKQASMWWLNDYGFEWDVDLTGKLTPGNNHITLRLHCQHHFGGIFRRPFLYRPG